MKLYNVLLIIVCFYITTIFAGDKPAAASSPASTKESQTKTDAQTKALLAMQCAQGLAAALPQAPLTAQMLTGNTYAGPLAVYATAIAQHLDDQLKTRGKLDTPSLLHVAQLNAVTQDYLTHAGHPQGLATNATVHHIADQLHAHGAATAASLQKLSAQMQELSGHVKTLADAEDERKKRAARAIVECERCKRKMRLQATAAMRSRKTQVSESDSESSDSESDSESRARIAKKRGNGKPTTWTAIVADFFKVGKPNPVLRAEAAELQWWHFLSGSGGTGPITTSTSAGATTSESDEE